MRRATRKIPTVAAIVPLLALACLCGSAQGRFRQSSAEYQARREKLRAMVDGPIVLYGYTGHEDASDVAVFFQEPSFYYLTGHDEPGAAILLMPAPPSVPLGATTDYHIKKGSQPLYEFPSEILYLPPRDPKEEVWEGPKIGPDDPGVTDETGFKAVKPIAILKGDLVKLAKVYPNLYTILPPEHEEGYPHFTESVSQIRAAIPQVHIKDIASKLNTMRQIKSEGELALMQKADDLSIDAHFDAMKTVRPGLFEYQIAARMKEIHEWGGCEREAYAPIVGAGFDSIVLHYSKLDSEIKDGDLVVIDVGGEYGGYAADITRTVPANTHFTPRQREIYDIVLGAQNAVLAAVKPGALLYQGPNSLQQIVIAYIRNSKGRDKEGRTLERYYPHGVSHHIGLEVHDPGDRDRPLEPGMVISVEPGIYIPEEKLGVRIEDDVLVTKDGYRILTGRLPRTADEIEKIMSESQNTSTTDTPCLFDFERGEVPACLRKSATGIFIIAPEYLKELDFDSYGLAAVHSRTEGWMYVNRRGEVLISGVPVMDNGADSFHDGLVRIVNDGKYGFANRSGQIAIAAIYDGALNFDNGLAAVCRGCQMTCADTNCEHGSFAGGRWFQINTKGETVGRLASPK
jgi:Xaa-Pro aminopeptidase